MTTGRPRLTAGSFGAITAKEVEKGKWRARTLYRDNRGKRREATKTARTKQAAINGLKILMLEEVLPSLEAGAVSRNTTMRSLAEMFLEAKKEAGLAPRSIDTYSTNLGHITRIIGDLAAADATAKRLQDFVTHVSKEHGPAAAKGCRTVLSGMMQMAVVNDVIVHNPVRSLERIKQKSGHRGASALSATDLERMRQLCRTDPVLVERGVGPLWEFMSYVGCRIGEALALRDSHVDLGKGVVTLGPSVARVKGLGLIISEPGKSRSESDMGWRTIVVPNRAREILAERVGHHSGLIFPSMLGHLRDPHNTETDWRNNRERIDFPTFTSHGFRKTVATVLDGSGLSARDIAEYLGHKNPSMTQDVYMAKNTQSARAAEALSV